MAVTAGTGGSGPFFTAVAGESSGALEGDGCGCGCGCGVFAVMRLFAGIGMFAK
jgi:hypothetical protein